MALPESEVVVPSEMIAYGDAVLDVRTAHQTLISNLGYFTYRLTLSLPQQYETQESLRIMRQRHNAIWNMAFADGHIDGFKTSVLFGSKKIDRPNEWMRRQWNRDHEPHWEEEQ